MRRRPYQDPFVVGAVLALVAVAVVLGPQTAGLIVVVTAILAVTGEAANRVRAARSRRGRCPHCRAPYRKPAGACPRCGRAV